MEAREQNGQFRVQIPVGATNLLFYKSSDSLSGPLSLAPIASFCPSPRLERQPREAHQTPPSGVEVKNEWHPTSITSTRLRDASWNNLFVTCANDGRFPPFRYQNFKILFSAL